MKIAVLILSIFGGIIGLLSIGFGFIGGAFLAGLGVKITFNQIIFSCLISLTCSILGIIGGGFAKSKPKIGGLLMIIAAIGGFVVLFPFYIFPAILFFVGGIISLMVNKK